MWKWICARLKEKSTWLGILSMLSAGGVVYNPALMEYVMTGGIALFGAIEVAKNENK